MSSVKRSRNGRFSKQKQRFRTESVDTSFTESLPHDIGVKDSIDPEPAAIEAYSEEVSWETGRRIVDLRHLAEELKECSNCRNTLLLHNIVTETREGLGSYLYIKCSQCPSTTKVTTGKRHYPAGTLDNSHSRPVFDVNTKIALGM